MTDAPDPSIASDEATPSAVAQRQLCLLGELAEIGLDVARAVGRRAHSDDADPAVISLAYARVSRAVRLTIMLQTRVLEGRTRAEAKARDWAERLTPEYRRKARVEAIVERIAEAEHDDEDTVDDLITEAGERLDDEDLYGDLMHRPISELVERLCRDLGLSPDWTALAKEFWAQQEIESGDVGGPLMSSRSASLTSLPPAGELVSGSMAFTRPLPLEEEGDRRRRWREQAVALPSDAAGFLDGLPP